MARSLVLGNGKILVCLDQFGQVKDFYFPYAGLENHIGEKCVHRIGISIDGNFGWIDGGQWEIEIDYVGHTMLSWIKARHRQRKIVLEFFDVVYNEKDIFIREIKIRNNEENKCQIKIFFNQEFFIYGTARGDTAYFEPNKNILVHYEGRRVFVVSAMSEGKFFDDYSVGIFGDEGKAGTWKDAEDSRLEKNPIEHGTVDSVLALTVEVDPGKTKKAHYWISVAKKFKDAISLYEYVLQKNPEHLIKTTANFWKAWTDKSHVDFVDLNEETVNLYKRSLLIMRTHFSENGSIIASGDSDMPRGGRDTYAYVWPRDAAFIMRAFDRAGYFDLSRKFFEFCEDVISREGYLMHKYRPDRSMGSSWHPWIKDQKKQLPIQEDETALVIWALWQHYEENLDLEFIEKLYNPLIKKSADFMCHYIDPQTNLPLDSYDIWEEKSGIATFTAAGVYGGLVAAQKFAQLLGKKSDQREYGTTALLVKNAIIQKLFNQQREFFYRMLDRGGEKEELIDTLDVSSFLGVFRFGVLKSSDSKLKKIVDVIEDQLYVKNGIGGIMRYQGDRYFQVDPTNTENPWFITTLWVAQYYIAKAKSRKELRSCIKYLDWVVSFAQKSGILSEQLDRNSGQQLSVAPLIWSHAEFVLTVQDYLKKYRKLD